MAKKNETAPPEQIKEEEQTPQPAPTATVEPLAGDDPWR